MNFANRNKFMIVLGDKLHDFTWRFLYYLIYPLFSVVRAAHGAIKEAWKDAE